MPSTDVAGDVIRPAAPPSHSSIASSGHTSVGTTSAAEDFPPDWIADRHSLRRCVHLDSRRGAVLHNDNLTHYVEVAVLPIYSFSRGLPVLDALAPPPYQKHITAERLVPLLFGALAPFSLPPPFATTPGGSALSGRVYFSRSETPLVPEARALPEWIFTQVVLARMSLETAKVSVMANQFHLRRRLLIRDLDW